MGFNYITVIINGVSDIKVFGVSVIKGISVIRIKIRTILLDTRCYITLNIVNYLLINKSFNCLPLFPHLICCGSHVF